MSLIVVESNKTPVRVTQNKAMINLPRQNRYHLEDKSIDEERALVLAAIKGPEVVVRHLLEKGANVAAMDDCRLTAMHYAASYGHETVVWLLLEKKANVAAQDGKYRWTVLHSAANGGHEAVVRILLEKGAKVAVKDHSGLTALHCEAGSGHEAVVRLLQSTNTPLITAMFENFIYTASKVSFIFQNICQRWQRITQLHSLAFYIVQRSTRKMTTCYGPNPCAEVGACATARIRRLEIFGLAPCSGHPKRGQALQRTRDSHDGFQGAANFHLDTHVVQKYLDVV
jgi:ankyrin repeat protein